MKFLKVNLMNIQSCIRFAALISILFKKSLKKTNNRSGKEQYLTFRRKIFSAYFITNLFDSLDDHGFLDSSSKEMIQNGIRLFYRHFLVTKEPTLSQEETHNPMFCMLYRFLLKDDMGYDFNTDTAQYFKRYLF